MVDPDVWPQPNIRATRKGTTRNRERAAGIFRKLLNVPIEVVYGQDAMQSCQDFSSLRPHPRAVTAITGLPFAETPMAYQRFRIEFQVGHARNHLFDDRRVVVYPQTG
jgi:hypothetical protein